MEKQVIYLSKRFYDLDFKHKICKEHLDTKIGLTALKRKYNLSTHTLIHHWLRELGYIQSDKIPIKDRMLYSFDNELNFQMKRNIKPNDSMSPDDNEIIRLKRELEDAKLRIEGYQRMIEIAEDELKIPIRKKFNTK